MKVKMYVIRHGDWEFSLQKTIKELEETGRLRDPSLTPQGVKRVKKTIPKIKKIKPFIIFSGTNCRHIETASILTGKIGEDRNKHIRSATYNIFLQELKAPELYKGPGLLNLFKREKQKHGNWLNDWIQGIDNGIEPISSYIKRSQNALNYIKVFCKKTNCSGNILVVASGETINVFNHILNKVPLKEAMMAKRAFCEIAEFEIEI